MAIRLKKRCKRCGNPTDNERGYCNDCIKYFNSISDKKRESAAQRGYSGAWRRFSSWFLSLPENQKCAYCGAKAEVVDHANYPAPIFKELFGDSWNSFYTHKQYFKPACQSCNLKKAKHDQEKIKQFNDFKKKNDFFV